MTLEDLHTMIHKRWLNVSGTGYAQIQEMTIRNHSSTRSYELEFKALVVVDEADMCVLQNAAATFAKQEAAAQEITTPPVKVEQIPLRKVRIRKPVHRSAQPPQDTTALK